LKVRPSQACGHQVNPLHERIGGHQHQRCRAQQMGTGPWSAAPRAPRGCSRSDRPRPAERRSAPTPLAVPPSAPPWRQCRGRRCRYRRSPPPASGRRRPRRRPSATGRAAAAHGAGQRDPLPAGQQAEARSPPAGRTARASATAARPRAQTGPPSCPARRREGGRWSCKTEGPTPRLGLPTRSSPRRRDPGVLS